MAQEPTSSFQIPQGQTVDVVFVRMADGRLVPRHPSELIKRPTVPAPQPNDPLRK